MQALTGFILVLFLLIFVAIVISSMLSGRPRRSRRLRGDDAIQDVIDRYDRRQRRNWYGRFWD
jgi:hypothetical protein